MVHWIFILVAGVFGFFFGAFTVFWCKRRNGTDIIPSLDKFTTADLTEAAANLEHAKSNRPGGLLVNEQTALDRIKQELLRRGEE